VKAGYVIRRILRRAVRYGYTFLGFNEPFLCRLVSQLVSDMGEFYPEIVRQQPLIEKVIREEELAFLRTLDRGIRLMDSIMEKCKETKVISGVDAFTLYDTYGFPIDLSQLIASENGYVIDIDGFNSELAKQKERARNATSNEFGDWVEYSQGDTEFFGYDTTTLRGVSLLRQRKVKQKNKEMIQLVFDRTPFYAEMGGEVGDTGYVESENGERIAILNTVKENGLTVHIAEKVPANPSDSFTLVVDAERRQKISNNHSCTHLLDQVLRETLGTHVEQKGSYVCDNYFRFDFSHFEKLSEEQIKTVEDKVNRLIRANMPLEEKRNASMEEAQKMGAIALFGEKYGDTVRVVKFGKSVELCGGCHTSATGNIGCFKISGESAIAAGIRRIEAITGESALSYVYDLEETFKIIKGKLGNPQNVVSAIQHLIETNAAYRKQAEEDEAKRARAIARDMAQRAQVIGGIKLVMYTENKRTPLLVRTIANIIQKENKDIAFLAGFEYEGKPNLILMYGDDLVAQGKNAGQDIREAAKLILGGGGGQPGLATAGGKDASGLNEALKLMTKLAMK